MQKTNEKKNATRRDLLQRAQALLRKQAEELGIPAFMLRLAASQRVDLSEPETTLRNRHD
jgi:hypothetical protein